MPTKRSTTRKRSRPSSGRNAANRKRKTRIPKQSISGGGSSNPTAEPIYRSNLLDQPLQAISSFKIGGRFFDRYIASRELCVELYKCLLKAPGFVDDKEWNEFPTIPELTEYLFSKLRTAIPKGYAWHFVHHYHNSTYCIKYFKCRGDLYEDGMGMPLEWTELQKDHKLYKCIMYITYAVSKVCGLDYIFNNWNDNFYNDLECHLSGEPEDDDLLRVDAAKYLKGGVAQIFYDDCKKLMLTENAFDIYRKVNKFVPKTARDKHLKKWLVKGIELMQSPVKIWDFCYPYTDPEMDNGEPLMVNSMVCFEWSFHDACFNHTDEWKESIVNEIGQVEPVEHGYMTPKEHVTPTKADSLRELYEFFNIGRSMYFKYFDKSIKKQYDRRTHDLAI